MRKKLLFLVFIIAVFSLVAAFWKFQPKDLEPNASEVKEWLRFLNPNLIPSEIQLKSRNNTFAASWNTNQTIFSLLVKPAENNVTYTLGISTSSYNYLDGTIARQILNLYSTLPADEFKCTIPQFNVEGGGQFCHSSAAKKAISIFSFRVTKEEGTYVSFSEIRIRK